MDVFLSSFSSSLIGWSSEIAIRRMFMPESILTLESSSISPLFHYAHSHSQSVSLPVWFNVNLKTCNSSNYSLHCVAPRKGFCMFAQHFQMIYSWNILVLSFNWSDTSFYLSRRWQRLHFLLLRHVYVTEIKWRRKKMVCQFEWHRMNRVKARLFCKIADISNESSATYSLSMHIIHAKFYICREKSTFFCSNIF